jgi:hypothetical protein
MGGQQMPDERPAASANSEFTAEIVAAYIRRNQVGADQLGTLISAVSQALANPGKPATEPTSERIPAVSIRGPLPEFRRLPGLRASREDAPSPYDDGSRPDPCGLLCKVDPAE